jgi:predicted O-methyltransferase YrrM
LISGFQIRSFINHWLYRVDEHAIHSPFFFDFYHQVIQAHDKHTSFDDIEAIRKNLWNNHTRVVVQDLGAASPHFSTQERKISDIAKTSLAPPYLAHFFFRIAAHIQAEHIVELGTSMGLTTLYLSRNKTARISTFEGNPAMISIALTHFELFAVKNTRLVEGNIDKTLAEYLQNPAKIDLAIIDANHQYEPTVRYFEWLSKRMNHKGVVILDDIYYSPEMKKAWSEIKRHALVYASMDLFRCGILFFDPDLNRQHYICSL